MEAMVAMTHQDVPEARAYWIVTFREVCIKKGVMISVRAYRPTDGGALVPLSFRPATAYRAIPSDTHRRHHRPRVTMAELIDGHVSVKQCGHAVTALMEYALKRQEKREENELLPGKEESIWLQIAVKEIHGEAKLKPHRMCVETPRFPSLGLCFVWADSPIKYPLVDPRTSAICLITKDPQREYKDLLEEAGVRFINRVVGIEKLKGKFKSFEARRALLHENALFLADERVIPLLPRLLGKIFFTAKKYVSFRSVAHWLITKLPLDPTGRSTVQAAHPCMSQA
jgi:hypothetical protein